MKLDGIFRTFIDEMSDVNVNKQFPQIQAEIMNRFFQSVFVKLIPGLAFGDVVGTGAAIKVGSPTSDTPDQEDDRLEFDPVAVIIYNATDKTLFVHVRGMAAASFWRFADTAAPALVEADGITLGTSQFTIGADATLNTAADDLKYLAIGR